MEGTRNRVDDRIAVARISEVFLASLSALSNGTLIVNPSGLPRFGNCAAVSRRGVRPTSER